ncbi:hypothetical protein ACNFJN_05305 [Xenorhabdus budapestensis]|uniref:hypothetical protein n=1 Tax=Xenorhabdus budapestensis TaxID=290110 RepID=UPI003A89859C
MVFFDKNFDRASGTLVSFLSEAQVKKSALLNKIKVGAQLGHYRLVYFDEVGFAASPSVQYVWVESMG